MENVYFRPQLGIYVQTETLNFIFAQQAVTVYFDAKH